MVTCTFSNNNNNNNNNDNNKTIYFSYGKIGQRCTYRAFYAPPPPPPPPNDK